MKPIALDMKEDGKIEPKWLTGVYAIGTVSLIIMWAYIISKSI